ncbi:MAG: glucokinase [Candidatus Nitricoxidivorans perseverans]|uniref:Glucokinase n=1 Tax=Candidatus Nitricoxidivorans perseverans TaxID=2975601 RepID=A0AA49ITP0_9PROT|nr:MAG: glucokinase [Candidatus Nitricoxidivorans perseverans]
MILIGDIGGTNARLALAEAGTTEPLEVRHYAAADFPDFESVLAAYLAATGADIEAGCLAVAGPIADDGRSARLTNLPWTIDADALAARSRTGPLRLANDFAAAALGVTAADPSSLVSLQTGVPLAGAPRLVVGAGTGLGMAILVPENGKFRVLPGEGGHVGFSPQDETQMRIHASLLAEHGRVTCEHVVSGPGLSAIHLLLAGESADPADIGARALAEEAAARRSVDVFLGAYGAFAGDMAMACLSRGGVTLAGGIIDKLLPLLPESPFLTAFNAKAEHAGLARRMPIHAAIDPTLGLKGVALMTIA